MIVEKAAICHNVTPCLRRVNALTELILDLTAIHAVDAATTLQLHVTNSRAKQLRVRMHHRGAKGVVQYMLKNN
jgi:hypothetical protein